MVSRLPRVRRSAGVSWCWRDGRLGMGLATAECEEEEGGLGVDGVLQEAGVGPEQLEKMMSGHRRSIKKPKIAEMIQWLGGMGCGVGDAVSIINRHPESTHLSMEKLRAKVAHLEAMLDMEVGGVLELVRKFPSLLGKSMEKMSATRNVLKAMGASQAQIKHIIMSSPQVFGLETASRVSNLGDKIRERCELSEEDLVRILSRHPRLLTMNVEKLAATMDFLIGQGMAPEKVISLKCSSLWGRSIENCILPSLEWLKGKGLDSKQIPVVLAKEPLVLAYTNEKLDRNHRVLMDLSLNNEEILQIYVRNPRIFGFNLAKPNMKSKMDFIENKLKKDVGKYLLTYPQFLNLSLKERIVPRYAYLSTHGFSLVFKYFSVSDAYFCSKFIKKSEKEYQKFKGLLPL